MAFQMIPPRVSSSPPPLDSLPTITCQPEDEDDDFGHFCDGHNASFDITGLSDKLPPTPASSPLKTLPSNTQCVAATSDHLNERTTEDSISQDSGVSTENQTSECSPKLPSENENFGDFQSNMAIISNVNGEEARNLEEKTEGKILNNDDDFGDFECFSGEASRPFSNKFQESVVVENNKNLTNCKDEFREDGAIIDRSSQVLASRISKNAEEDASGREIFPCSRSTSVSNSNNMSPPRSPPPVMMSPPPLDKLAPRRMSGGDEDEFGDFVTGHPGIMEEEDDDDFGDFTSTNINSLSTNCDSSNKIIGSSINLGYPPFHNKISENKEDKVNEINSINRSKDLCSEQLENCVSCTVEKNISVDIEVNKALSEESSTTVGDDWQSADSGELAGTEELTVESFSDERLTNTNQIMKNNSVQNNIEIGNDTRTLQLDSTNKIETPFKDLNTIGSSNKNDLHESFQGDNEFNGDDVDDFGDFTDNYVESNEVKTFHHDNDDDDFDDFVSPENAIDNRTTNSEKLVSDVSKNSSLVNEVEFCSNLNPSNVDDDDFGDFDSARRDSLDFDDIRSHVVSSGISEVPFKDDLESNDISDNDFGDFETAVPSRDPVSDCGKDEIDENNDFGDFTNADFNTKHNLDDDDDDEFGDFNASIENQNFRSFRNENSSNSNHTNNNQLFDQKFSTFEEDKSLVVRKLESLLLRWIPPIRREERTTDITTRRLQQMVKEDAFIWHQLEDLDSSPALNLAWPQSHVHKLFLASVNVDARNIVSSSAMTTLFGQKWSSSVPLFAQTLTFSPLTPAKHIESTEECLEREDLATKCPQNPLEDTVEGGMTGEGTATGGDTEEQIPEAKFDWTSSGLTNPLESTGLEREFLSESSSTGISVGERMKTPPSPSPLVQQILSGNSGSSLSALTATTNVTPITSLQPEVQEVVAKLPDLSFMKSRVLMFPIRGEQ